MFLNSEQTLANSLPAATFGHFPSFRRMPESTIEFALKTTGQSSVKVFQLVKWIAARGPQ